jgi:RES domain-containing protein
LIEIAYRIAKTKDSGSHEEMFSGIGAAIHGGRWNSKGHHMVYASDSCALATLEIAVHLKNTAVLAAYSVCQIVIPEGWCEEVTVDELPDGWDELVVNPLAAQSWGDLWLEVGATPAVKVPSVVMPAEWSVLLNPGQADATEPEILQKLGDMLR